MNARNIGGWSLLLNALLVFVVVIGSHTVPTGATFSLVLGEIASMFFIAGLWAIWTKFPQIGLPGQAGVGCLGIATGLALVVRTLILGNVDVPDFLPFTSALFGLIGSLLLGWAILQTHIYHPIIAWLLMASGMLNLAGGLLQASTIATTISLIADLAQIAAIAGMGWSLLRHVPGPHLASLKQE